MLTLRPGGDAADPAEGGPTGAGNGPGVPDRVVNSSVQSPFARLRIVLSPYENIADNRGSESAFPHVCCSTWNVVCEHQAEEASSRDICY
jgi:hypothetical protein